MRISLRFAVLLLLTGCGPAMAADTTGVDKEKQSLEEFADANKTCQEWSDGCAVCARREDGSFHCSLPGISCQPTGLACRKTAPDQPAK